MKAIYMPRAAGTLISGVMTLFTAVKHRAGQEGAAVDDGDQRPRATDMVMRSGVSRYCAGEARPTKHPGTMLDQSRGHASSRVVFQASTFAWRQGLEHPTEPNSLA